jgi:hypothetical protein
MAAQFLAESILFRPFAKSSCQNVLRLVPPSDGPEFTIDRALHEDKLKLEVRTIARRPSLGSHSGNLLWQTVYSRSAMEIPN